MAVGLVKEIVTYGRLRATVIIARTRKTHIIIVKRRNVHLFYLTRKTIIAILGSEGRMPNDRSPETKKTAVSSEVRTVNLKISSL